MQCKRDQTRFKVVYHPADNSVVQTIENGATTSGLDTEIV